ncbi:DUF2147 domain-containing protein [Flavobacterium sp.]|jgi:uncharacterized protein (DUF2147 family)|uniref:DUF2147 domain-containing protein n=1 Tax=Flavobacterium sp. TaxID=239 RepID=UPI003BE019F3
MKNNKKIILFSFFLAIQFSFSQSVLGRWKTVDDETKKEKGIVEIYEKEGKIYGKIVEILEPQNRNKKCVLCEGSDKDKPILGIIFVKGLTKEGSEYNGGEILDPKNGKLYKCYITLESKDKLKVRGYVGISLFGRTQYWYRVK